MAKTYTAVPTVTAGDVYTAASYNTYTATNVSNLIVPPAVFCTQSSGQTVARVTWTALQWNGTDRFDTDSMHDTVTNNTRITINTAGIYLITFQASFTAVTNNGTIGGQIRLNGSTTPIFHRSLVNATTDQGNVLSGLYDLAVNDYIEAFAFHAYSTTSMTTDHDGSSADGIAPTSFSAVWVGRTS